MSVDREREVLMVTNAVMPDQLGGLQRYVRELAGAVTAQGWPVRILTKRTSPELPAWETFDDGVQITRISAPARSRALYALRYPLSAIASGFEERRRARGIVHVHYPLQGAGVALAGGGHVHTFHAPVHREVLPERAYRLPAVMHTGLVSATRTAESLVARTAAESIVLTEFTRSELAELAPRAAAHAHLIPAGLDADRFSPGEPIHHPAAAGGGPLLFTARRLVPRTGVRQLVAAMPAVVARFPAARLVVAGDGPLRGEIERQIADAGLSGHVTLLGRVSDADLVGWHRAARLFVLPTQELEGFGMSTVEALACGTPAVGTPAGGTPEVLSGLDPALIADATDPPALARAILRMLVDPGRLASLAARARAHVVPRMSWSTIADRHLEIYARGRTEPYRR